VLPGLSGEETRARELSDSEQLWLLAYHHPLTPLVPITIVEWGLNVASVIGYETYVYTTQQAAHRTNPRPLPKGPKPPEARI
jgi:hypothetical protein